MNNETIALEFFARWDKSFEEACMSFEETFAPGCRWDQSPIALTFGAEAAIEFMAGARQNIGLETIGVDVLKIASVGNSVLCERVDHLRGKHGKLIASAPVVGVLDFEDGKIVSWREYFDSADFAKQVEANSRAA